MEINLFKLPEIKGKPFYKAIKCLINFMYFIVIIFVIAFMILFFFKYKQFINFIQILKS